MRLGEALSGMVERAPADALETEVSGIQMHSSAIEPGDAFVAWVGHRLDGRSFVSKAIEKGARAILTEDPGLTASVPVVVVPQIRERLGVIASKIYRHPSRHMRVVGVTGTNGKTTTAYLVSKAIGQMAESAGYVGTLGYLWDDREVHSDRTTPESTELQKMLSKMRTDGVSSVAIECSSHGIEMGRLNGIQFDAAVFTNLTQDHLDYHQTMDVYAASKGKLFFDLLERSGKTDKRAVFNIDDEIGKQWFGKIPGSIGYSLKGEKSANLRAKNILQDRNGIRAEILADKEMADLSSPLMGTYNLSNLLASIGALWALGYPVGDAVAAVSSVEAIPGRLEKIGSQPEVVVDYAHTDDAFVQLLSTLRPLCKGRLIHVFGCGGSRDKTKRPKMMQASCRYADVIVLTSDNPRDEDPAAIASDVLQGRTEKASVIERLDRKEAIFEAISMAEKDDWVVITGKGHESYQEIRGQKTPFDDRRCARQARKELRR